MGTVTASYNDSKYAKIVQQDTGFEPNIIDIRGNGTGFSVTQVQDFFDQTNNVTLKYQHPNNGPLIGYGYHFPSGYFTVDFLEGSEVNNSTIEDIYMTFETEAQKMGILEVGVVFQYSDFLFLEEEELLPDDTIQTEEPDIEIHYSDELISQEGLMNAEEVSEQIDYDYYFGLYPYDQQLIERYGTLPVLETEQQKENWNSTLEELSETMKDDFTDKYLYPYGDVVSCGSNSGGYLVILFRNSDVDKQLMNEIYSVIDDSATDQEIKNIPVEFGYGDYGDKIMEDTSGLVEPEIQGLAEYVKSGRDITVRQEISTLAIYGEVPEWDNQEEFNEWYETLRSIQLNTRDQIFKTGKVATYGGIGIQDQYRGSLRVGIKKSLSSEEKMTSADKIYAIIDEEARKVNITDVPVVFYEDEYVPAFESVEEAQTIENETENTNKTPGFSALTLISMIFVLWKFKSN